MDSDVARAVDVELHSIHFLDMKMTGWVPVPPGAKFYPFTIVRQIMDSPCGVVFEKGFCDYLTAHRHGTALSNPPLSASLRFTKLE